MKNIANKLDKIAKETDNPKLKQAIKDKQAIFNKDKTVKK